MQCPICFEEIASNYIILSKCGHKFCPCICENETIRVLCCPLCRSEDLTFLRGQEVHCSEYERRCLACDKRVSNVISDCTHCSAETKWVLITKKYNAITFGIPDITCISFKGQDRPNCMCCYAHFTKRILSYTRRSVSYVSQEVH